MIDNELIKDLVNEERKRYGIPEVACNAPMPKCKPPKTECGLCGGSYGNCRHKRKYVKVDNSDLNRLLEMGIKKAPPPPTPPPSRVECGYCHYVYSKGEEFDNHKCSIEKRAIDFIKGLFK